MIRRASVRPCSTHPARSSNASASNSKFLNGFVKREPLLTFLRCKQAALHRLRFQEVSCLPFGRDVVPQRDRHNHGSRLAALIGDVLDFSFRHRLQCTPFQWQEAGSARHAPVVYFCSALDKSTPSAMAAAAKWCLECVNV